jgi:metal-sulfur cluster biosynthetic enzyme
MSEKPANKQPIWDAEAENADLCQQLRTKLHEVADPEIGLDIIQLGLIRNVTIGPERAIVRMILTTPFCPYGPAMIETTREKAQEVLPMEVAIDFGVEPWDFSMMEEGTGMDWGMY